MKRTLEQKRSHPRHEHSVDDGTESTVRSLFSSVEIVDKEYPSYQQILRLIARVFTKFYKRNDVPSMMSPEVIVGNDHPINAKYWTGRQIHRRLGTKCWPS